jgi:Tfp pilus assembly protein PilZ
MERKHMIAGATEVQVNIRVRGMTQEQRYFDEQTSTTRLTQDFIVIRLRARVDLDAELHVTNMRTQIGGTYRVAWINTRAEQGRYPVGLELLDSEGEIWEPDSIPDDSETAHDAPAVLLECQRCRNRVSTVVSEAETDSLGEGFTIACPCDTCKATTGWVYSVEAPPAVDAPSHEEAPSVVEAAASADASAQQTAESSKDQRQKGRAPIRLVIKIIRTKYGLDVFDICETINVSRTGVYFTTEQGYEVGENLEIILPYHPDSMAIPVPARVVRQDERPGTYQKRVAIRLTSAPPPTS